MSRGERVSARSAVRTALASCAALAVLFAGGCASIPSAVSVQSAPTPPPAGESDSTCCQIRVSGPHKGGTAVQSVEGFLLASAAGEYATAREYLTSQASGLWHPGSGVTILSRPAVVTFPPGEAVPPQGRATVPVSGEEIATLSPSGQYIPAPQGLPVQDFDLVQVNGTWLIAGLPIPPAGQVSHELLLTDQFFHLEYRAHDLYYYAAGTGALVPDPVFLPTDAADPLATLLHDLLHGPGGWLQNVAGSAFPPGTRVGPLHALPGSPGGRTALVDLQVPPTSNERIQSLAEQLVTTLTSKSYGPALFAAVRLQINGRPWRPAGGSYQLDMASFPQAVTHAGAGAPLYYVTRDGTYQLGSSSGQETRLPGQAGQTSFSQVAVSAKGGYFAGLSADGTTVDTAYLKSAPGVPRASIGSLRPRLSGHFTSLSWDTSGNLWVAGQVGRTTGLWVIPAGSGAPARVRTPGEVSPVTAVRVAPDGVRVAMVVGGGSSAQVELGGAVRGSAGLAIQRAVPLGLAPAAVSSLTWYDADDLLALTGSGSNAKLWLVPVDGDSAVPVSGPSGMATVTAAGPDNPLYVSIPHGRMGGQLEKSFLSQPWTEAAEGRWPAYPG